VARVIARVACILAAAAFLAASAAAPAVAGALAAATGQQLAECLRPRGLRLLRLTLVRGGAGRE
jgi:hypothetical protein